MFMLTIETDNAAFTSDGNGVLGETARILRVAADKLESYEIKAKLRDVNGNTIGEYHFEEGELRP